MNLLEETLDKMKETGQSPESIVFIGSLWSGHQCSWSEFLTLANREYDEGFGAQEVASDLCILFRNGARLTRHEYDGSESWDYHPPAPLENRASRPIRNLFIPSILWSGSSLQDINEKPCP